MYTLSDNSGLVAQLHFTRSRGNTVWWVM